MHDDIYLTSEPGMIPEENEFMGMKQWVTFETNEGKLDAIINPHLSEDEMYDQGLLPEGSTVRGYVLFKDKCDAISYTEQVLCQS